MTKITDIPAIRFKGFSDTWEQRKLGDVVDVRSGKDYKHLSEGNIPVYGTGGFMLSVNQALSYDEDAIGIGRKGTIDKPYILKAPFWTVDTLFYAIPREKVDLNFAFDVFQNIDWKKKDESTGVPSLSKTAINEIDVLVPQYDEQQPLGQFFNRIDNLITLHQRKYDKLTNVKKSMLEKMFPQNGSNAPEIRFKGFTEAWEQRKLGEVIRLNGRIGFRGYTEKDIVSKDDGGVLTFSPTNIVDNKLTTNCKNTYITRFKYDESPEIKIHNGDILFVKTGSTLGKSALVTGLSEDATLNPQVVVMRTNNLNAEFLAAMLVTNAIISQVNSAKIGGAVPTLTETRIKDFDVAIPVSEAEKEQIGQFFSQLDHLITLHQCEFQIVSKRRKARLRRRAFEFTVIFALIVL